MARGGGEVKALAIDVEEALLEYLDMFYNLRGAGRALRQDGRDRLRHVDRARPARRPAHRQDQGGGTRRPRRAAGLRRRRRRRPADRPDHPVPRRHRRDGPARAAPARSRRQSDGVMAVLRSPQTAVHLVTLLEDMPVQETADAIAELTGAGLPVGSVIVNMARRAGAAGRGRGRGRRRPADAGATSRRRWPPAGLRWRRRRADALAAEVVEHAERWARAGRARRRGRGAGPADRRAAAARRRRWTWARCSSWPGAARSTAPGSRVTTRRCPARGPGRADRRPGDPDRRLLRLRRRGQDDDVGGAGPGGGRGGPTVVVLTIDPARRLAQSLGLEELDNEPRRVERPEVTRGRRRTARDDAGHEADVRRHRRRALHARAGRADPREPLLPDAVVVLRRDAGVHGDGEAGPAAGQRPVGPDHRRHPAVAVGAGLPRRPATG